MPINQAAIKSGLMGTYGTAAAAAQAWGNAVGAGIATIVPPSTTAAAAITLLKTGLTTAFGQTTAPYGVPAMEQAFASFAASLALGMAPAFTAVAPTTPVGFATLFNHTRSSQDQAAQDIASAVVSWLKTGSATLNSPPGTVSTWV